MRKRVLLFYDDFLQTPERFLRPGVWRGLAARCDLYIFSCAPLAARMEEAATGSTEIQVKVSGRRAWGKPFYKRITPPTKHFKVNLQPGADQL